MISWHSLASHHKCIEWHFKCVHTLLTEKKRHTHSMHVFAAKKWLEFDDMLLMFREESLPSEQVVAIYHVMRKDIELAYYIDGGLFGILYRVFVKD